jgi:hypothetical protein
MRYRIGNFNFLERFVKAEGKGEVWDAVECYRHPEIRTDNHDYAGHFTGHTETVSRHCGVWCPQFEQGVHAVHLHCESGREIQLEETERDKTMRQAAEKVKGDYAPGGALNMDGEAKDEAH